MTPKAQAMKGDSAGKCGASRTAAASSRVPATSMIIRPKKGSYAVPEMPLGMLYRQSLNTYIGIATKKNGNNTTSISKKINKRIASA